MLFNMRLSLQGRSHNKTKFEQKYEDGTKIDGICCQNHHHPPQQQSPAAR
jgi:hypothetical protein